MSRTGDPHMSVVSEIDGPRVHHVASVDTDKGSFVVALSLTIFQNYSRIVNDITYSDLDSSWGLPPSMSTH